jgi:hypothetical protein
VNDDGAQPQRLRRAAERIDDPAHRARGHVRDIDAAARPHLHQPLGHQLVIRGDDDAVGHIEVGGELARAGQTVAGGVLALLPSAITACGNRA